MASEAITARYGGITGVHEITGIPRSAIYDGMRETKSNDKIMRDKERICREGERTKEKRRKRT